MSAARSLLDRAIAGEERAEAAEAALERIRARLNAAIGADPGTATAALAWMTRARLAENLLREVLRWVDQRSLMSADLPPGWVTRAQSQIAAADVTDRDLPVDRAASEGWAPFTNPDGSPAVLIDRRDNG